VLQIGKWEIGKAKDLSAPIRTVNTEFRMFTLIRKLESIVQEAKLFEAIFLAFKPQ
jgi:hypothetical protein